MKKVLSLIAALSLTLSMSATVFAAEETGPAIKELPNGQNISITATYEKGKEIVETTYHVTVSWEQTGTLVYKENSDTYTWNPDSLDYTHDVDNGGDWSLGKGDNAPKVNITVTNRSNAQVYASITKVEGVGGITVNGNQSEGVIVDSAAKGLDVKGEQQTKTLTYEITGVTGKITGKTQIATLTVGLSASNN